MLPRVIRERIGKLFQRLEAWPAVSGAKPLTGNLAGWYRLRTGHYRIRFRIEGETVIVAKIGHASAIPSPPSGAPWTATASFG